MCTTVMGHVQYDSRRWKQLLILAIALMMTMTTWFSTAAVLPQIQDDLDLSSTATRLLAISVQLGFVFGALGSAILNLADRVPPRRLVLFGAIGAATINAIIMLPLGLYAALLSRFFVGMSLAGVYPPSMKSMSSWFVTERGLALGVIIGSLTLGSALPHLIRSFGNPSWQAVIVSTSIITIGGGLIADLVASDGPHAFPSAPFDSRQVVLILQDRRVMLASLGYFGHMWELYAMWSWIGVFFGEVFEGQQAVASLVTFFVIGIGAVGSVVGGLLSDRTGRTTAASVAMASSGVMATFIGFLINQPGLAIAAGLVWGFWVVADSAQFSTIVTEVTDQRYVGTALTVQLALGFIFTVFTIYLVPFVQNATNWGWAFALLAPGPALGVIAMIWLQQLSKKQSVIPEDNSIDGPITSGTFPKVSTNVMGDLLRRD